MVSVSNQSHELMRDRGCRYGKYARVLHHVWRRPRNVLLVIALALLAGPPLMAIANASEDKAGDVTRVTLENGLRVVIVRNPLAPVVTTVVSYLVGSNETPPGFPGMAHAQEHMMFRGSPGLSADQLSAIAAGMGGNFDAQTQQTATQYFFTVPVQDLDVALQVEATRMAGVLDTDDLWKQERGAIEQEVAQDYSSPQYVFFSHLLARTFAGTPYAHDALGTRPSFERTTGAMLKKFYDTWYAPNNAILVIAGGVDPQQVLTQVKSLFEKIPAKKLPSRAAVNIKPFKSTTLHQTTDLSYGLVTMTMRMPGYNSPDYAAMRILDDVLNSQRANLYGLVVSGAALDVGFDRDTLPDTGIGSTTAAFPKGSDPKPLLKELKKILADYARNGVPAELVEAAKRRERAAAEFRKDSVSGLAMLWSKSLAVEGRDSPQDNIDAIGRVSVEDVNRVAHRYLDLRHVIVGILTPSSSAKPVSTKGFGGTESFATSHVKDVKLPKWATDDLARLSLPESLVKPEVTTLPNGIKLIVQPESVSDTVSVIGGIKHNAAMQVPTGKEGVDAVLDRLFSFGTTHLDRIAFQKALDDIAVEEDAGPNFYVQSLTDKFDRAVELLADNELNPALPKEAFAVIKDQVAASIKGSLQSPDYLARRALHKALFPENDPIQRRATPETVDALNLDDVRHYYEKTFRPDLTTIVVIGKITPEHAREIVEKYFGAWKAEGPKPDTLLPKAPPNKPSVTHVPNASQVQVQVTLAQTLDLNRFNPDYYALELGNRVLSGGFYASRLYRDLREDAGLVYFVGSSFNVGETRGVFSVNYASDPPKVSQARTLVLRDLKAMQENPVSEAELHQAKALVLRQIPMSEASIGQIAQHLLGLAAIGLPLDESTRAARRYFDMTAEQVQTAYKKWLRPADMIQLTEGPPPS
jgi:zinc protease